MLFMFPWQRGPVQKGPLTTAPRDPFSMDRAALTSHCPPGTSLSPAPTWTRPPAATLAPWTRCGLQLGMLTLAAFQGSGLLPRCHARLATSKWKRSRVTRPSAQGVPEDARALLLFWFGPEIFEAPQRMNELEYLRARKKMWYTSGGKYDEASRQFLPMLRQYDASKDEWQEEGSDQLQLAKVVLFDQIPRNVFRGTSDAFRYDEKACAASEVLIDSDFSRRCSAAELLCIVQPFVHAEGPGDSRVQHAIHILQKNMRRFPEDASNMLFQAILSHDAHGRVLRTFGRYPHRNTLLGRRSSPEELQPERAGDGSLHSKSFAHTDKGMYFMGMTLMNYKSAPSNQPWIELRHPQKLRWSQGCGVLRLKAGFGQDPPSPAPDGKKVFLPDIRGPQDLEIIVPFLSENSKPTNPTTTVTDVNAATVRLPRLWRRTAALLRHLAPQSTSAGGGLVKAAQAGDIAKCQEAVANGADVNARDELGYTALHWAAKHGLLELCKLLREKGAELDVRSQWDETPLIMAAKAQKSLPTCDFLVSEGADMQAKTNDRTGARRRRRTRFPRGASSDAEPGKAVPVQMEHPSIGGQGHWTRTTNNSDPIVEGIFDRKVDPHGENYSWFLVPDEDTLEMTLDKDKSEVYQTFSYGTLLWPRLFNDDIPLGCLAIRNVHSCPTGWPRLDRNR
ncbi:unnamed protein product [Durusdinium trenchii]|uniref:Uncharacterized protein n=1 Tax=Durusdinium trenchii TaxID=1381693 RepID=A0ABP0QC63_9DINO